MLSLITAELKLVIAGNHDLDLDRTYQSASGDPDDLQDFEEARALMTGPLAKEAGVTYLEEGMSSYMLGNGARFTVYSSPYQPEFCNWAFAYERDEDRFNPEQFVKERVRAIAENPIPDFPAVDVLMTHGPPKDILDWTEHGNVGCEALMRAVGRARPRLYCFGHIHEAYGARIVRWKDDETLIGKDRIEGEKERENEFPEVANGDVEFGRETLMVNAAIMNLHCRPTNSPWMVELQLPKAE
jgi:hypothetical protein